MKILALGVGGVNVQPPAGIPTGGLTSKGFPIIRVGISLLLLGAGILSLAFIILGGVKLVTSSGDKQAIQSARLTITYAVIGLALSFFAFVIIQMIGKFFNVTLV